MTKLSSVRRSLASCDRHRSSLNAAAMCVCRFLDLSEQNWRNFGAGYRSAEVIALHLDACVGTQDIQLFLGFDAFGRRRLAEADGKSNHGTREQPRFLVRTRQFIDEAAIDLDFVE